MGMSAWAASEAASSGWSVSGSSSSAASGGDCSGASGWGREGTSMWAISEAVSWACSVGGSSSAGSGEGGALVSCSSRVCWLVLLQLFGVLNSEEKALAAPESRGE